ncbi:hypothetical protein MGN70_005024 [Eutypa lata]|nr:hypothetical protein MGN70_005024 [Eutypa lata]
MATSNPESSTRASWGSPASNGNLASQDPSAGSLGPEDVGSQGSHQDDPQQTSQSQQVNDDRLGPDHHCVGTACRHPYGNRQCPSHSNNNGDFQPATRHSSSTHSPANDLAPPAIPHRRAISLPVTLETFTRDVERYEGIAANGITPGGVEDSEDNHEQLSEPEAAILPNGDLPEPINQVNGGAVPNLCHIGSWCCPPPWS